MMKRWWAAGLVLLVILGVVGSGSDDGSTVAGNAVNTAGGGTSVGEKTPSFENGVLTTSDLKIQITRHEVIDVGEKGNEIGDKPVIAFWYTVTNLSGDDVDPTDFIFNFKAYQDNNPNAENELEVGGLPDDRFLETQSERIKKGGTVENAVAYELDDMVTPVELVASDGPIGDDIGKATYALR
jgi:hypothetical protein